jgi:hypothetical protein
MERKKKYAQALGACRSVDKEERNFSTSQGIQHGMSVFSHDVMTLLCVA